MKTNIKTLCFESERLIYTGITMEDTNLIVKWRNDEEIFSQFKSSQPLSRETHLNWMKNYLLDETRYDFIFAPKISGKKIGIISIQNFEKAICRAEIGYLVGEKNFTNKGYATEAVKTICEIAHEKLNITSFYLTINNNNNSSIRIANKACFIKSKEEGQFNIYELNKR